MQILVLQIIIIFKKSLSIKQKELVSLCLSLITVVTLNYF